VNRYFSGQRPAITWFVSRHPGAIEWARRQGLAAERWVEHLAASDVEAGDIVIGTLSVTLAADVCKRGARYVHLSFRVPADWRGRELSTDDLLTASAALKAFRVEEA